jgi:branched-chain amino acid aminotransferase
MGAHYINGSFVANDNAKISLFDLGLSRGYGICEFLRTYHKKPFHLHDHLVRLDYSAKELGLTLPLSFHEIQVILETLLEQFEQKEASIKILLTGNQSSHRILPDRTAALLISAYDLILFEQHLYEKGVIVSTTEQQRAFPKVKTLFYLPGILGMKEGEKYHAFETIHVTEQQEILEGATSNFFCFKGNTLITSNDPHLLHGITREIVLRLGRELFTIEERPISMDEIQEMDEAFLTSSTKEVLPIKQMNQHPIGNGQVGPHTKTLMRAFKDYTQQAKWPNLEIARHEASAPPISLS